MVTDESRTYAVNPTTGAVGSYLAGYTWYDEAGNTIKQQGAGSNAFSKTVYDSLGRAIKQYVGYDLDETPGCLSSDSSSSSSAGGPDPGYLDAANVDGDTILEQSEAEYDDAGQIILTTSRQRFHNATGTGELQNPSGDQPKARVSPSCAFRAAVFWRSTTTISDEGARILSSRCRSFPKTGA